MGAAQTPQRLPLVVVLCMVACVTASSILTVGLMHDAPRLLGPSSGLLSFLCFSLFRWTAVDPRARVGWALPASFAVGPLAIACSVGLARCLDWAHTGPR